MGGYNTLVEAVFRAAPTLCVPRTTPRKEQWIRARAFSSLGLLRMIEPRHLSVSALREEIDRTLQQPRHDVTRRSRLLDFSGAQRAAAHLLDLAAMETPVSSPLKIVV
jgi:predicted glycosyltransferase